MGVNMAGNCIIDDEVCCEASKQEIIRRYYQALARLVREEGNEEEVYKIELLMKQAKLTKEMRRTVPAANERAAALHSPAAAMELNDGRIVTGKTSNLLGASAALILNAVKLLAGIPHDVHLIAPSRHRAHPEIKGGLSGKQEPADSTQTRYSSPSP